MNWLRAFLLGPLALLLAACGGSGDSGSTPPPATLQYLFVQSADGGSFVPSATDPDVYLLTLEGVRAATTFFSDRPYRLAGMIDTRDFIDNWNDTSDDGFLRDPPNAALQLDGAPEGADVVILELLDVLYDAPAATLKYRTKIVRQASQSIELFHARGDAAERIPARFGSAGLFIDSWYSRAWHKVKQAASDTTNAIVETAADKLKKAEGDFVKAVQDNAARLDALAKDPGGILAMADNDLYRLVMLALPSGLGSCTSVAPVLDVFDPTAAVPLSFAHVNWMQQRADRLGPKMLRELALPGSHDSGTYPITGLSVLTNEANQVANATVLNSLRVLFPASYPISAAAAKWSRAQRHTILAQLSAGVRYLDLRMIPDPTGTTFWATHVFGGAELTPMLTDIGVFLAANPREVVVLDFQHLFNRAGKQDAMDAADAELLLERIRTLLGKWIVTTDHTSNPKDMTLSAFWELGRQVVILFDPDTRSKLSANSRGHVWPSGGDVVDRFWPNKAQWGGDGVKRYLDAQAGAMDASTKLAIVQGQMTPDPELIKSRVIWTLALGTAKAQLDCLKAASGVAGDLVGSVSSHLERLLSVEFSLSLQEDAFDSIPLFREWLRAHPQRHVVVNDFIVDYPDLITQIIELNR